MKSALDLFHRLLLRWSREHSHVLLACGYGLYLWIAQSFTTTPGPGLRAMSHLAQAVAPEFDAVARLDVVDDARQPLRDGCRRLPHQHEPHQP